MFFPRLGGRAQIYYRVRLPEQFPATGAAHAQVFTAGGIEKTPAIAKAIARQRLSDYLHVRRGVGHRAYLERVINIGPMIFQVIYFEAEPPKPNQVMQQLPDHARERVAEGKMQNNDGASGFSLHQAYRRFPLMCRVRKRIASGRSPEDRVRPAQPRSCADRFGPPLLRPIPPDKHSLIGKYSTAR